MSFLRKLHKWLGLIVAVQLILWTISGAMFAWLDHHEVSGEHRVAPRAAATLQNVESLVEPQQWLHAYASEELRAVRLSRLAGRLVWRVETANHVELRDAASGELLSVDAQMVRRLAQSHYAGPAEPAAIEFHAQGTMEARRAEVVWSAHFDDDAGTTLYFAAEDGRFVVARTDAWRLFDFFWMLHTMDYRERDDFNHPLIVLMATGALWLAISGILLLTQSFRARDVAELGALIGIRRKA